MLTMDITDVKVQKDLQRAKHIDTYKHTNSMHARVIFWGGRWIDWNIVSDVYIFTRGKSINAEKNENVELTHTQVFCGRLCVLCEYLQLKIECIGATDTC